MGIKTDNMIFVFGSNIAGIHGRGAALWAKQHRGAMQGRGVGRTGQSYALPTKDRHIKSLQLQHVHMFVEDFLIYAAKNPHLQFQVTAIGCGLAGFRNEDIAPMFILNYGKTEAHVLPNCYFDEAWKNMLSMDATLNSQFWGTFGS